MPCYQVNQVSLDFEAGDQAILKKAAAALGLEVIAGKAVWRKGGELIATLSGGKATCEEQYVPLVNKLRVQYSKEIVSHACLKLGWQKVVKSDNKIQLKKGL